MGAYWLHDLPDVVADAGLRLRLWDGWEDRSRSSGGYDQVYAVFAHHTASKTTPDADCRYMWETCSDGPVGAMLLDRDGVVTVGAAGATNTQGKGGPWTLSRGTIPLDKGNAYGIAVEAANAGTGEAWPAVQTDAYVILCAALCDAYGLDPARDCLSHFEWVQPSCPGRKIDPAGPSPWAVGTSSWQMDAFRTEVVAWCGDTTPPPPMEDEVTDDDIERIAQRAAELVWAEEFNAPGVPTGDNPQPAGWLLAQGYGRTIEARDAARQAAAQTKP